jgi:hypothetical protein
MFKPVVLMIFLLSPMSAALAYDNPKALVEAIYRPYIERTTPKPVATYYSESLRQLSLARSQRDGGEINFDPFVNGKSSLLFNLQIGEPLTLGDRALINVSFHNFDHPTVLTLALIEETRGWKVDDIASMGVERHWLLSWLLAFDPFDTN